MTDFPGVPGTATIAQLLGLPNCERIKVRFPVATPWRPYERWSGWHPTTVVYVQQSPPDTITLPSGRTAQWLANGCYLVRPLERNGPVSVQIDVTDHDALAAWVTAHREAQT